MLLLVSLLISAFWGLASGLSVMLTGMGIHWPNYVTIIKALHIQI